MTKIWQNLPFRTKISVLVAVLIGFLTLTCLSYNRLVGQVRDLGVDQTVDEMLQRYKGELKDVVDVMALSLASAIEGIEAEPEIYNVFSRLIKKVRFFPDSSGYYFIYKVGGTVFTHAAQPQLEGKNLISFKDPEGKFLIRELDRVSQNGGGFVEYVWEKPGKGLQPKLSYSRMIPGTDFWVGTGVYIDDIHKKEQSILAAIHDFTAQFRYKLYSVLGIAFILIVVPLSWLVVRSIVTPVLNLSSVANAYSLGDLDLQIPAAQRNDEIGKLAQSIERLGTSSKLAMERLKKQGSMQLNTSSKTGEQSSYGISRLFTSPDAVHRLQGQIGLLQKETRRKLTMSAIRLLQRWQISTEDQLNLLGLSRIDQDLLADYGDGRRAPESVDVLDRIGWLLCLGQSLRALYANSPEKQMDWLNSPNVDFGNAAPLKVLKTQRMAGLILVTTHLDSLRSTSNVS